MSHQMFVDNESKFDFGEAVNDILNFKEVGRSKPSNCAIEFDESNQTLIDNFNFAKNVCRKNEATVQEILEFCAVTKTKLKLNFLNDMLEFLKYFRYSEVSVSKLMTYLATFVQTVDYIESISDEMRVIALEQPGEVLDTLRAATRVDGIFFINFYNALNQEGCINFEPKLKIDMRKILFYAIGVFIMQMFFIIEQYTFLAAYYYKNGNFSKYDEYLKKAFLIFKQMKSQLVGRKNIISDMPIDFIDSETLLTWQTVLNEINFPNIFKQNKKIGSPSYDIKNNEQQLNESSIEIQQNTSEIVAAHLSELDMEDSNDMVIQLFQAILKCQIEDIKSLVAKGVDITKIHQTGKTVLDFAIISGNLEIFKYFFEAYDLNIFANDTDDSCEIHLLFSAAKLGSLDILKYLIEVKDLNPQLKNSKTESLLCAAIAKDKFDVVKYLIEDQGVPITSSQHNCPLCVALEIKSLRIVKFILDKDLSILDECDQRKALLTAIDNSNSKALKLHLELGASIDVRNNAKRLFDYAAIVGNLDLLKYLVEKQNCELNTIIARTGLSTLFQVARVCTLEDIKYFVEKKKFSIFDKGPSNGTILHEAAFNRNLDVIKYLVEKHGLDAKARDTKSFLPIFYAAQDNNLNIVKYFIEKRKLGIHLKDKHNRTLLHIAAMNGHLDVVRYLVEERNANLSARDNEGFTPFFLCAQFSSNIDLWKYFLERVSDVSLLTAEGAKILHLAAKLGNVEIINILGEKNSCGNR